MMVQEPVQAAIWHCLNHYDLKDAVFLAERLCSEVETDETIFLLATSYYRSDLVHQAYWLLKEKSRRSPQCRYLQAICAYQLKKFAEAECALTNGNFADLKNFDEIAKDFGEIACFVLKLIAEICIRTERSRIAMDALRKALKLNPFMWHAFAELCHLGENADASAIFQITDTDVFNTCQGNVNFSSMILFGDSAAALLGLNGINGSNGSITSTISSDSSTSFILSTPVEQQLHPSQAHNQNNNSNNNNNNNINSSAALSLHTPNNNNIGHSNSQSNTNLNLNSSMTMLRGNATRDSSNNSNVGSIASSAGAVVGSGMTGKNLAMSASLTSISALNSNTNTQPDDTPIGYSTASICSISSLGSSVSGVSTTSIDTSPQLSADSGASAVAVNNAAAASANANATPFRKQFKYLTSRSPSTPSFGFMPLTSPCNGDASFLGNIVGNASSQTQCGLNVTSSPLLQTLVNQEQKLVVVKKIRNHTSSTQLGRKDSQTHIGLGKPAVFTQTGNITPRTPSNGNVSTGTGNPNAAVRRSSRLFSNSAYSVKENNKSPTITSNKFAQPRSPPRKTKSRMAKICLSNELIEEKSSHHSLLSEKHNDKHMRKEKEKDKGKEKSRSKDKDRDKDKERVETITSHTVGGHILFVEDKDKVLLNNSMNNAQTLAHHMLAMKKQSADGLMALLRDLGQAFNQYAHFKCDIAIRHLEETVPKHHLCSPWVQSLIGMAYYELSEYESAVVMFKRVHEEEPYRLDCMDFYSSSLWHLQREVDLSSLAQDLMNQDKTSPVTWCVAGNCFSLHKEHETAIKFFRRAVQVDPEFVYSYTLLGHELVLTEELDKAMDFFRSALVRDPRHYNAWFGIGTIYSKQEKYELAEIHYIKALKINPQNTVIMVHIGAMQYFMQKKELALQTLNTAATLDPKNPLARFHRGSIYFSLGRHQEALRELEELKEIVPKESVVFYLIGKIHKTLGNVDSALMHFSWATDLDPKGANNQIKDAFDSMSHPSCCPLNEPSIDPDLDPVSDRSDDSTQAQQDLNYDSDAY